MTVKFTKKELSNYLPEKRPNMIFSNPDLLIMFEPRQRIIIWNDILNSLDEKIKEKITCWPTWLDFGDNDEDYEKIFKDYSTIELSELPSIALSDDLVTEEPIIINSDDHHVYLNMDFINQLKLAGAVDVWYDTIAPFGRY